MRYLVKIYVGTHFPDDDGTNVSVKITADTDEQARERAVSLLAIDGMDAEVYETWETI
ncbi:MAG: hypothetical protein HFH87_04240 [Lachnospiraceae bacterium]|nr:hypothetical protein [Lachnospiraceae bacterium]